MNRTKKELETLKNMPTTVKDPQEIVIGLPQMVDFLLVSLLAQSGELITNCAGPPRNPYVAPHLANVIFRELKVLHDL